MDIIEAKAFYKKYMGEQFHMGREEWSEYQRFQALNVNNELLADWDQELFEEQQALLREKTAQAWIHHENLLKILARGKCDPNYFGNLLLTEMEKMTDLDEANLILVTENMAGRDRDLKQGGVYFFCTKTALVLRMKNCMGRILASAPETPADSSRLITAIERYNEALKRFVRV